MIRTMMNSKIHRARVTESNLNYVGSITIDADILDAVDIFQMKRLLSSTIIMGHVLKHMLSRVNVVVENLSQWCCISLSRSR